MTCNWMTTCTSRLLLALVVPFLFLHTPVCNAAIWQDEAAEAVDEDEDDDDDDEVLVQNNPWGIDERKLEAAELFRFRKVYAIEVMKIKSVCDLDKKQTLKLQIAVKGAAKKEIASWKKKWRDQMKQFQGMNFGGNGNQRKKKKNRKELVIKDADEIDQQTMQYLNNTSMLGGNPTETSKAIDNAFWRKTVKGVLTSEQFEKYESFLETREKEQVSAKIDAFVLKMQEDLSLTDEQIEQYDALVRPHLEKAPDLTGYYETHVFPYYASKYDKKKMKALLDEDQLQLMKMILGPSKAYGGMFDQQAGNAIEPQAIGVGFGMLQAVGEVLDGIEQGMENFVDLMKKGMGAKK